MTFRRWPLALIAAPACVAIWSGWVTLGGLCGFGVVEPFPGIVPWHVDTAITLPVGIESYAAFALGVWLRPSTPERAQRFARLSALGALCLGMLGQVSFHLLAARHASTAPDVVVVLVACLPVVVLGCAVGLMHLLRNGESVTGDAFPRESASHETVTAAVTGDAPHGTGTLMQNRESAELHQHRKRTRAASAARTLNRTRHAPVTDLAAEQEFMAELSAGTVPSKRQIRSRLRVGQDKANKIHAHLTALADRTRAPV